MGTVRILLVGEGLNQHSQLGQSLACWGAESHYASSCGQACAVLKEQSFDLVISRLKLRDGSASRMIPLLEGSPATLFCSQPVAIGCWWLPVIERGKLCWGAPALRAKEFGKLLHRMLTQNASQQAARGYDSAQAIRHLCRREAIAKSFHKKAD
jgi:hypothetical protein